MPSLPIFVTMVGTRPRRAAAVSALAQLPPPCVCTLTLCVHNGSAAFLTKRLSSSRQALRRTSELRQQALR
jgi:hypothetical protein